MTDAAASCPRDLLACGVDRLPHDVLLLIFAYFSQRPRLLVISLVRTSWRKLVITSITSFRYPDASSWSYNIASARFNSFGSSPAALTKLNVFLPREMSAELRTAHLRLSALTKLKIDISGPTPSTEALQHWHFPLLRSLTLTLAFVPTTLRQFFLHHASYLMKMNLDCTAPIVQELACVEWPSLRKLFLHCPVRNADETSLFRASCPVLFTCWSSKIAHDVSPPLSFLRRAVDTDVHFPNLKHLEVPISSLAAVIPSSLRSLCLTQGEHEDKQITQLRYFCA